MSKLGKPRGCFHPSLSKSIKMNTMKILILSSFYPPDIGPGSFRAKVIEEALLKYGDHELNIDVITPDTIKAIEKTPRLTIFRIKTPAYKKNFLYQVYIFIYFAIKALTIIRSKQYDIIVVTSSRLGTAALGAGVAHFKSSKFYLELREIFPDNMKDIFGGWRGSILSKIFSRLENWVMSKPEKVNLISPGFMDRLQQKYPGRIYTCFTHGVNPIFINQNSYAPNKITSKRLKVYYAGNVGYGQQLHLILPKLAKRTEDNLDFYVIGDGNNLVLLQNALKEHYIHNVILLPTIPCHELIPHYQNADILFLHIAPYPFAAKVLPSKLFEYAATGKPIWAGVFGYSKHFIEKEITNCAVFQPCDINDALLALSKLSLKSRPRTEFNAKFNQETLMKNLAHEILSLN
jgi:hypothetical protein